MLLLSRRSAGQQMSRSFCCPRCTVQVSGHCSTLCTPQPRAPAGSDLRHGLQIVLLCLVVHAGIQLESSVTAAYQIVRVLRLLRFFSLLRRLYATAIATSAFVLPGLSVSPPKSLAHR